MNGLDTRRTSMAYRISKRLLGLMLLWLCTPLAAHAQAATPTSRLAWDEVGQSAAIAQAAIYTAFVDGSPTGLALAGVTCVAGVPTTTATCSAPMPALVPGTHTLTLTQTIGGVASAQSAPITFSYVVVVVPTNLRIQ